ncbi:MAG: FUN14 domain-containing protein [Phycisphaerales bacterium]
MSDERAKSSKERSADGVEQTHHTRPGPVQMTLLVLSGLVMIAGVALGVMGTLEDEAAVERIQQQQAAAATPKAATDGSPMPEGASGFVGQGGDVSFPFPVPGLPGSTPTEGEGETAEGQPTAAMEGQQEVTDPWSPAIFRMGFGFFVGFSMAYALKAFSKVTIVSAGIFFLLLFGLQYAGLVEVKWTAMADRYDTLQEWLKAQLGGFQAFVTGYVPSAGAALAGLALGFMRK